MVKNLIPWRKKTEELTPSKCEDNPFELLHRQMNDLFEDFFDGFSEKSSLWPSLRRPTQAWTSANPTFEVSESDDEVRIKAEMPGMDEENIEILLDENVLTIRGEKKDEREKKKRNYYVSEVRYGQFHRSIDLPTGIDQGKAKAKFKRGVLTLTLPKTEQAKLERKRIHVSTD